jgi:hypothetical protein
MKIFQRIGTLCVLLGLSAVAALADDMAMPAMKPNAAFDEIKGLAGNWAGQTADGKPVTASYQVVSAGSCVMETLDPPDHGTMITMYRVEGGRLVMDHYCAMNNVPHMRGTRSADGKQIDFAFTGASNMSGPKDAHMHALKLTFDDSEHLTHEWSMQAQGKVQPVVFHFARAK